VFLVVILLVAAGFWWQRNQALLLWSDIREGDGSVLSLAAGKDSRGNEIVVAGGYFRTDGSGRDLRILCYDAADGRVRWETREDKALPNMMTEPIISIDSAGDVLVGWEIAAARFGANKVVSKYAGIDGHLLWNWSLDNTDSGSSLTAIPLASESGALWVSGIRKISGEYRRFVAALDMKTGVLLWEDDLNVARDGFDRPAEIQHLKNGGAMVVIPPPCVEGKLPWIIQNRSGVDGGVRWQHEILWDDGRFCRVEWLMDQANDQMVIAWNSKTSGQEHVHIAALNLTTGAERWHVRDINIGELRYVESVTLGQDGGIELWGGKMTLIVYTKWWRWRINDGIPSPERLENMTDQPLRVTLSPMDGSIRKSKVFARPEERVKARLGRPGEATEVLILQEFCGDLSAMFGEPEVNTWRAKVITPQFRLVVPIREPEGTMTSLDFPDHAVLTPSGRLVIGGCPAKDQRQWQIRVW